MPQRLCPEGWQTNGTECYNQPVIAYWKGANGPIAAVDVCANQNAFLVTPKTEAQLVARAFVQSGPKQSSGIVARSSKRSTSCNVCASRALRPRVLSEVSDGSNFFSSFTLLKLASHWRLYFGQTRLTRNTETHATWEGRRV